LLEWLLSGSITGGCYFSPSLREGLHAPAFAINRNFAPLHVH
jgi:hypothetical protein